MSKGKFYDRAKTYLRDPSAWHPREIIRWFDESKDAFKKLIITTPNRNPILVSDEVLDWYVEWFEGSGEEDDE